MIKKIVIGVVILIGLLYGTAQLAYYIVDWEGLQESIEANAKKYTGHELKIKGGIKISFFPQFEISASNIDLENVSGSAANIISISQFRLVYSYVDILLGRKVISEATLIDPEINLQKFIGKQANWAMGVLGGAEADAGPATSYSGYFKKLTIVNGSINITTGTEQRPISYRLILDKGSLVAESSHGPFSLAGLSYGDIGQSPIEYDIKIGDLSSEAAAVDVAVRVGGDSFKAQGEIRQWETNPALQASFEFLTDLRMNQESGGVAEEGQVSDVKVTGEVGVSDYQLALKNTQIVAAEVALDAEVTIGMKPGDDGVKHAFIKLHGNEVNFDNIFRVQEEGLIKKEDMTLMGFIKGVYPFVDDTRLEFDVLLNKPRYRQKVLDNFTLKSSSTEHELIHAFAMENAPGGGEIRSGITLKKATGDATGNVQAAVKDAQAFFDWLGFNTSYLNPNALKDLKVASDIHSSEGKINFDQIEIKKSGKLVALGRNVVEFSPSGPKSLTAFRIPEIEMASFFNIKQFQGGDEGESFDVFIFDKLRNIDAFMSKLSASLQIDRLAFENKSYADVKTTLEIEPGSLKVQDLSYQTSSGLVRGNLQLNTQSLDPVIHAGFAFETLTFEQIREFLPLTVPEKPKAARTANISPKWSSEELHIDGLAIYTGSVSLRANKLVYGDTVFHDITLKSKLGLGQIDVTELTGKMFDSKFEIKGSVTVRPLYVNFIYSAPNIDIRSALDFAFGVTALEGRSGISVSVSISGNSQREWVESLQGTMNVVARNLTMRGFDLALMARKLPTLEDVRAVRFWGHKALNSGMTPFNYFASVLYIEQGVIKLRNAKLPQDLIADSKVNMDINMPEWKIKLNAPIKAKVNRAVIPLVLNIEGSMDSMQVFWDRKGIEQYWAQRFF